MYIARSFVRRKSTRHFIYTCIMMLRLPAFFKAELFMLELWPCGSLAINSRRRSEEGESLSQEVWGKLEMRQGAHKQVFRVHASRRKCLSWSESNFVLPGVWNRRLSNCAVNASGTHSISSGFIERWLCTFAELKGDFGSLDFGL